MANTYLHGSFANLGDSVTKSALQSGTVAVYVGVAPVNLVPDYAEADCVNLPVKVSNFTDAQKKFGYSENWEDFTLCEAFAAHFDNGLENIGPIYCINVLDPDKHKKTAATNIKAAFDNKVIEIKSDTVILDTVSIAEKVKGVDFSVDYNFTKGCVVITALKDDLASAEEVTVAYYEVDLSKISATDIIGGATAEGVCSGLGSLQLLYPRENQVADLLACPGYSENKLVYAAMVNAASKINGHWEAFCFADIPIANNDTLVKARNWRKENGYNSERTEIGYPLFKDDRTDRIYHWSTLNVVAAMLTDYDNDGIPFESPSNKETFITRQYFGADSKNKGFDQITASNDLNAYGISTSVFWGGKWVTWGGHTAKYEFGKDIDARAIDTQYVRMLFRLMNGFQQRHASQIDKTFNRMLRDSILNEEQDLIDTYINRGALLPGSRIEFVADDNSTTDMMNGDWFFRLPVTVTPRAKSITGKVYYTDEGLASLVEEA